MGLAMAAGGLGPFMFDDAQSTSSSVAEFVSSLATAPALLGLGEPTHGVEEFLQLRNDLFGVLVDRHGYRAIALEADALAAPILDRYVCNGDEKASLDDALATGFSHGFGDFAGNRALLTWLRHHNQSAAEPVRIYGFDAPIQYDSQTSMVKVPSPRDALSVVVDYLARHDVLPSSVPAPPYLDELVGDDAIWSDPIAHTGAPTGCGDRAAVLRVIADDLVLALQRQRPQLVELSGSAALWQAQLHARSAVGLLRFHAARAAAPSDVAAAMGVRAAIMADNLLAILQAEQDRGPVLAFAHNGHLQKHQITWSGTDLRWWGAGSIVASIIGNRYIYIAGDYLATRDDHPGTFQHLLANSTTGRALFSTRQFGAHTQDLATAPVTESAYAHAPVDPKHLDHIDAIAFLGPDAMTSNNK